MVKLQAAAKRRGRPPGKQAGKKLKNHESGPQKLPTKGKFQKLGLASISTGKRSKRRPRIIVTVLGPEDETPKVQ